MWAYIAEHDLPYNPLHDQGYASIGCTHCTAPATPQGRWAGLEKIGMRAPRLSLPHLDALEAEAIHVMREVAAELERPVLLFSGGKDSIVLLRLAEKAFRPAPFPFPSCTWTRATTSPRCIEFRDRRRGASSASG